MELASSISTSSDKVLHLDEYVINQHSMSADKMAKLYIETLFARHFAGSGRFELPYQGKSRLSGLNHLKHWVEVFELDAGISRCKAPVSLVVMVVAAVLPDVDLTLEGGPIWNTPIEALAGQNGELGLGHIEPATVLGRVVPFEPLDETAGFLGWECLVD
jgi:hypothetical protein